VAVSGLDRGVDARSLHHHPYVRDFARRLVESELPLRLREPAQDLGEADVLYQKPEREVLRVDLVEPRLCADGAGGAGDDCGEKQAADHRDL
jgi:hypothetical protein